MYVNNEPVVAQCYLQKKLDEANVCYLSPQHLFIRQFNRLHSFSLDTIRSIEFKHKLLLFPLIAGGIISPLSLIALFNDILNIWLMMGTFIGGLLSMYYGMEGSSTLTVVTSIKEFDFFLKTPSKNLKAFISFVLKYSREGAAVAYYFHVSEEKWSEAVKTGQLVLTGSLKLTETAASKKDYVTLRIEPLSAGIEVKYLYDEFKELAPFIEGTIPVIALEVMKNR